MPSDIFLTAYQLEEHYWWYRSRRRLVKQLLPASKKPLQILDIGCGAGKLLEELQKYGRVYGLDSNPQAIKFCKKRGLRNIYHHQFPNLKKLPFRQQFDLIICLDVIEHIANDTQALEAIAKLLRPQGRLILTVPAYAWFFSYWDQMSGHHRRYTRSQLSKLIKTSSLKPIKTSFLYSFLMPIAIPFRLIKHRLAKNKPPLSDLINLHPLINQSLFGLALVEQIILKFANIPFGLSLICVAEKP